MGSKDNKISGHISGHDDRILVRLGRQCGKIVAVTVAMSNNTCPNCGYPGYGGSQATCQGCGQCTTCNSQCGGNCKPPSMYSGSGGYNPGASTPAPAATSSPTDPQTDPYSSEGDILSDEDKESPSCEEAKDEDAETKALVDKIVERLYDLQKDPDRDPSEVQELLEKYQMYTGKEKPGFW